MARAARVKWDDRELQVMIRDVGKLPKDLRTDPNGELRDAAGTLAQAMLTRMRAYWSASGTEQDNLFSSKARVKRDRRPAVAIRIAGYRQSKGRSEPTPLPLLFWGAEFGNYGSTLTFTRPHNADGYSVFRAVREVRESKAVDEYEDAVLAILRNRGVR